MGGGDDETTGSATTVDTRTMSEGEISRSTSEEPELETGTLLGRYLIVDRRGAGGMGVVYAAYDPELDRRVAIKLMRSARWDTRGRSRLLREAQAMARLSHPNVVTVYDVGTFGDQVFLAMELVNGVTAKRWCREAPRSWRAVLNVFVQAGRGLAAAHRARLVHRDVKPSNILVNRNGRALMVNFGLARPSDNADDSAETEDSSAVDDSAPFERASPGSALSTPLTKAGAMVGTPGYMAPEQLRGLTDARTDQYGFCVALHESLFGSRPRPKGSSTASTVRDTAQAKAPPANVNRARVPSWVRRVVQRGLSDDPAERFASMDELVAALSKDPARRIRRYLLAGTVVALIAASLAFAIARGRSDRRACTGAERKLAGVWDPDVRRQLADAFRALGTPVAAGTWTAVEHQLDAYAGQWVEMHQQTCEATVVRGEQSPELLDVRMLCLSDRLAELRGLTSVFRHPDADVVARANEAVYKLSPVSDCADVSTLAGRVQPPRDPGARARLQKVSAQLAEAKAMLDSGRGTAALARVKGIEAEATALDYRPVQARVDFLFSRVLDETGDPDGAVDRGHRAAQEALAGRDPVLAVRAWSFVAVMMADRLAKPDAAVRWVNYASARLESLGGGHDALKAEVLSRRGLVAAERGDYAAAEKLYLAGLAIAERVHGPDSMQSGSFRELLGLVYYDMGDQQRSLEQFHRYIAIVGTTLGAGSSAMAKALNNLSLPQTALGKLEEARATLEKSIRIYEDLYGRDYFFIAMPLCNLGDLDLRAGELAVARKHYQRAVTLWQGTYGAEHPDLAHPLSGLASVMARQGDLDSAKQTYQRAIALWQKAHGPKHPFLVLLLTDLGSVYLDARDPTGALEVLQRAQSIADVDQLDPRGRGDLRYGLARALWPQKARRKQAHDLAVAARADYEAGGAPLDSSAAAVRAWLDAHPLK